MGSPYTNTARKHVKGSKPFVLIKKRPARMLSTIDSGSHQMTFGVSGGNAWRRIRAPEHDDLIERIEGEEAQQWLGQRRFFDRIISATQGAGSITAIKPTRWDANECLEITTQDGEGALVKILVDPQTMYPIVELQTLADGTIKQTVPSYYRDISGMPIPVQMDTFVADKLESRITLNTAKLNTGVLSKLFEMPESRLTQ
ncbi:MAG: hypothetical protein ACI8Z5_001363 [Lentimonas sp.]|jgi:hypothetical protein